MSDSGGKLSQAENWDSTVDWLCARLVQGLLEIKVLHQMLSPRDVPATAVSSCSLG